MNRELIGVVKPETIFASDFEYIFMCRFLPFWLPSPTAASVLLWRTFGKCFLSLILSPGVGGNPDLVCADRTGRGEGLGGGGRCLSPSSRGATSSSCWRHSETAALDEEL